MAGGRFLPGWLRQGCLSPLLPGLLAAVVSMLLALGGCLRAGFRVAAECLPLHVLSLLPWGMSTYLLREGHWGGTGGERQGHGLGKSEPWRRFL